MKGVELSEKILREKKNEMIKKKLKKLREEVQRQI
jgi:hypothetical protein